MRTNIIKLLFLWIILIAFPSYGSAYVVGRDDVDTRFFSTGLQDSGDYLFTYKSNGTARLVVNRDLLGDGSGPDNRFALPMTNGLSFYDANIDEIRTGSIYGAASGAVLFGGVVAAPFIASAATTAYYATGVTFYAATQAVNNYSSSLVNKAEDVYYKLGIQYMSETPNIVNVSYKVGDFFRGFNPEAAGAPDTEWSQIGGLARGLFDEIKSLNDDLVKIESNLKYKVVDNDY